MRIPDLKTVAVVASVLIVLYALVFGDPSALTTDHGEMTGRSLAVTLFAIPLRAIFSDHTANAIEEAIAVKLRELLAEHERQHLASEWLSVEQMAERLAISPEAVRKRARRGRLEVKRHGRRLLVRLGSA